MATQQRDNLAGIGAMAVAVATLSLMDAGLKVLAPHYPPVQVAALRGMASLPLVLAWVLMRNQPRALLQVRWPLHLVRGLLGIAMLTAFSYSLKSLPLATAYTLFFIAPLLITALSAPMLGEQVGPRRWIAIGVGLAGVLIVLRPTGAGLVSLPALAVLFAAVAYALSAISVRILGRSDSTQSMVFWLTGMVAIGGGLLAWPTWVPIQWAHAGTIMLVGVLGFVGQLTITTAFRRGEASVIAPLEYTALAWGIGIDWLVWRTAPDALMLAGAGVIVASGIYLIRHERRQPATAPA